MYCAWYVRVKGHRIGLGCDPDVLRLVRVKRYRLQVGLGRPRCTAPGYIYRLQVRARATRVTG